MREGRKQARKPVLSEDTKSEDIVVEELDTLAPKEEPDTSAVKEESDATAVKEESDAATVKKVPVSEKKPARKQKIDLRRTVILSGIIAGVLLAAGIVIALCLRGAAGGTDETTAAVLETETEETTISEEEIAAMELEKKKDEVIAGYKNLGIVNTEGFINMRTAPNANDMTNIIGLLNDKAVFDILEDEGEWLYVESGGLTGYIASRYVETGDKAKELARDTVAERAVITTEVVNIRSAPEVDPENVCGKARCGERYTIKEQNGDWALVDCRHVIGTNTPYINLGAGNAEVKLCLDEARNRDMRELALTQFNELVVCNTKFLNIRTEPSTKKAEESICGKFLLGSGAELLDTVDGEGGTWYKIRSGNVKGYVSAQYCLTGTDARTAALDSASLTARINTDNLNVRTKPTTDSATWTQVTSGQAYNVLDQLDGWVEIDLDTDDDRAFVSTANNYVTLTYGLAEAVEYYPAKEASYRSNKLRKQIVDYACQFVGNPYVWGGTSLTNGCDCSGFVQSVLKHFGYTIERSSQYQARCGVRVTSDKMRPGDLIFYANSEGTINHVAMYIGNGMMVNAASRKSGIKIYRWNYRTPVAIRNVLGD